MRERSRTHRIQVVTTPATGATLRARAAAAGKALGPFLVDAGLTADASPPRDPRPDPDVALGVGRPAAPMPTTVRAAKVCLGVMLDELQAMVLVAKRLGMPTHDALPALHALERAVRLA